MKLALAFCLLGLAAATTCEHDVVKNSQKFGAGAAKNGQLFTFDNKARYTGDVDFKVESLKMTWTQTLRTRHQRYAKCPPTHRDYRTNIPLHKTHATKCEYRLNYCDYGKYLQAKYGRRYKRTRQFYCKYFASRTKRTYRNNRPKEWYTLETKDEESGNFQVAGKPGHCGIATFISRNGRRYTRDNMWHVQNSGMDNFLKNCADSKTCRLMWYDMDCWYDRTCVSPILKTSNDRDVIVDAIKSGVDCTIETKDYIEPKEEFEGGECRASLEVQELGNLESSDKICLSLTDSQNSEITNACKQDDITSRSGKYFLKTDWFSAQNFKATISANNFNQYDSRDDNERWYADDLKITCRQCMPECTTTCQLNNGLIEVTHDNASGHTQHRCYMDDQDMCQCECQA